MAKSKSTRQQAELSQLPSSCVRERVRLTLIRLAEIKAQVHVVAAASEAMESGAISTENNIQQCHITAAIEALIAPCDELYDALDPMALT